MLSVIRRAFRRSRVWVRFQELRREGWANVWRRWRVAPGILRTPPVRTRPPEGGTPAGCEVHILVWDRDHLMGLWAAKTFYAAAGVDWPLFWHQGGPLSPKAAGRLRGHFPDSRLMTMDAADRAVNAALDAAGLAHLRAARAWAFMLRKLVDPVVFGRARHLLLLDTDVLFFARPAELLGAVAEASPVGVFNRDLKDWYTVTSEFARERFGIELPDRLNAGFGLVPRATIDLERADRWLAAAPELLSEPWLTEQTIQALFAGVNGVRFLSDAYRLSSEPGLTAADGRGLVAKHYVSHPRPLMFREGIPHVLRSGLLGSLRCRPCPG
jgi:hypothetical protein